MATQKITLTGRPPVTIDEDKWPMIASACDDEYDGQYRFQANCVSEWFVGVRQHEDGRALVYATYSYTTNLRRNRDYAIKRGVLLAAADMAAICDAIGTVCRDIADAKHDGDDAGRWPTLADECIADLPAEELT
jgi:hypothetical protein